MKKKIKKTENNSTDTFVGFERLVMWIFNLGGEFEIKWLKKIGIWRLLYFGLMAKIGITTVSITDYMESNKKCRLSVGLNKPDLGLWMTGYSVIKVGEVFGESILFYTKSPSA